MARSMVCSLPECQALPPEVTVCPCYAAATEEDIRTTWRHIDAPATRTVRVPVNAPSAATAAEAVRLHLTREGRRFLSVTASPRAGRTGK